MNASEHLTSVPVGLLEGVANHAAKTLAAESRYISERDLDDPLAMIQAWLATRSPEAHGAREPDVVLVLAKGQLTGGDVPSWLRVLTVHPSLRDGPIVIRRDEPMVFEYDPPVVDVEPERARDFLIAPPVEPPLTRAGYPPVEHISMGAGGACARHGVYEGLVCPGCKEEAVGDVREALGRARERVRAEAQGAGSIRESGTMPKPWEPDERQQKILDALRAKESEYAQAAEALKRVHMGGKDGHLRELEQRRRGIGEARYLVLAELRRLYGPQGIA